MNLKEKICAIFMFPFIAVGLVILNIADYFDKDPRFPPNLKEDLKCLWKDTFG